MKRILKMKKYLPTQITIMARQIMVQLYALVNAGEIRARSFSSKHKWAVHSVLSSGHLNFVGYKKFKWNFRALERISIEHEVSRKDLVLR